MFGFLKQSKAQKVNLHQIAEALGRRHWEHEMVKGKPDTIAVLGKYMNKRRTFHKLYLQFIGGTVKFSDQRGYVISVVSKDRMYPEMMDILNVLP
ncbi:hypothetical protein PP175_27655 (plasmid) [Aneurinibacillus sp. Ricciae_BoGa-3]|uniref:hypothetical protein n=1 Tax=Aneurinibacillus sp. Ricciae_BoGa-3 TaxID=3022697 RepID=UPI00234197D8|nr:hypothetical protein [Aneurinibacillus sp. Ricciae_BoGa-3]WCK56970.1 hypothetical protein PP175_27655 [Aneurinibacillus sp. Ricciae_BoGa-3]